MQRKINTLAVPEIIKYLYCFICHKTKQFISLKIIIDAKLKTTAARLLPIKVWPKIASRGLP